MLHRILFIIFCLSVLLVLPFSCLKKYHTPPADNPYGLPNATQTGQGTFGCRINGLNYTCTYKNERYATGGYFTNDTLVILVSPRLHSYYEIIQFKVLNPIANKTYKVTAQSFLAALTTDSTCEGISRDPTQGSATDGSLTLTKFDTLHTKIASGTFACDILIPNCDTLHITDGRFDYLFP